MVVTVVLLNFSTLRVEVENALRKSIEEVSIMGNNEDCLLVVLEEVGEVSDTSYV